MIFNGLASTDLEAAFEYFAESARTEAQARRLLLLVPGLVENAGVDRIARLLGRTIPFVPDAVAEHVANWFHRRYGQQARVKLKSERQRGVREPGPGRDVGVDQRGFEAVEVVGKAATIDQVAAAKGLTKRQAGIVFDAIFTAVKQNLAAGARVSIAGLGSFSVDRPPAPSLKGLAKAALVGEKVQFEASRIRFVAEESRSRKIAARH